MRGLINLLTYPPFLGGLFVCLIWDQTYFFRACSDTMVSPEKVETRLLKWSQVNLSQQYWPISKIEPFINLQ